MRFPADFLLEHPVMKFHWLKRLFFIARDQKGAGVTKNRFYISPSKTKSFFARMIIRAKFFRENISAKIVLGKWD
jgi:hypothetical protein